MKHLIKYLGLLALLEYTFIAFQIVEVVAFLPMLLTIGYIPVLCLVFKMKENIWHEILMFILNILFVLFLGCSYLSLVVRADPTFFFITWNGLGYAYLIFACINLVYWGMRYFAKKKRENR